MIDKFVLGENPKDTIGDENCGSVAGEMEHGSEMGGDITRKDTDGDGGHSTSRASAGHKHGNN